MARLKRTLDVFTLGLCAVAVILGILAARRLLPVSRVKAGAARTLSESPPVASIDGELFYKLASSGNRLGPSDAPVAIVVFANYGCGYCAKFEASLRALRQRFPQQVAVVVKHYAPAADRRTMGMELAAECAADQDRFAAFDHAAFVLGPSLLAREQWLAVGDSIGIPNAARYAACVRMRRYLERVRENTAVAERLGVTGTPTSFINGIRIVGAVSVETLDTLVAYQLDRAPRHM
jgi:protein-disulfide isomerase